MKSYQTTPLRPCPVRGCVDPWDHAHGPLMFAPSDTRPVRRSWLDSIARRWPAKILG